ncbi:sigma-54-dependent transcriptional regulator [Amphiplicatus metriothermophilus]|uniref:DNA-binding transcriptional regulator NtrC n=1 Tax=Amphiplicatus metriothermophilus TaxID=1519374 RepID=A0A239PPG8_9PROT|nr:sigma-54 dependent transcriptional regulator [Amphiplicatus metriothermophilus]MBB5518649.1 DNA-binding NtrC family response regulator [Amphiplicatus metriothermophilus]SNT72194.1 DNA-binding transcriptional response regulator, NtrC family, contains REC, AAA-type ATPase, and a Fis-type DNA-binding domains [Amphiplicatus metriothermophilus]
MAKTILIVDDDPTQRRIMRGICEKAGYPVLQADSGENALSLLQSPQGADVSLILLDLRMPGLGGMETLKRVKSMREELPVIVLTAQGGVDTVVQAMQNGAADFFVKPASPERVIVSINNALNMTTLKGEVSRLKRQREGALGFKDLVGESAALKHVVRLGERAAASNIPILITGESGVGKEMIARAIQGSSDRAGRAFITVNCGAIPANLVESILFGHEKGSFTGATARHVGKFQEADGGTIFLDEVGELPLDMQVKLLRVLQEGEVDPIGAKRPVKVDVRIISATNRDLAEEVKKGAFREDLYYRLNVFPIVAPPLRARPEDIPALIDHFIQRYNAEEGRDVRGVRHEVLDVLTKYSWPGNVRQLENAVFRAVVLADGPYLTAADFPQLAAEFEAAGVDMGPPFVDHQDEDEDGAADARYRSTGEAGDNPVSVFDREGNLRTLEEIERDLIRLAIETYDGRMTEVARRLGMGRSTLYRKIRDHGIEVKRAS